MLKYKMANLTGKYREINTALNKYLDIPLGQRQSMKTSTVASVLDTVAPSEQKKITCKDSCVPACARSISV